MTEEAKEMRRAYYKKYREKNKDKVAQYNRSYWERKVNARKAAAAQAPAKEG